MRRNITKIIFALLGLSLIGVLIFFYVGFNGNPIKVLITRGQVKTYLHTTYPGIKFTEVKGSYNFKTGDYGGTAMAHVEPPVRVHVTPYNDRSFRDNLVVAKLEAQAKAEIYGLTSQRFPDKEFYLSLLWDEETIKLPLATEFSKDLPVNLFFNISWRGPEITKDEFLDEVLAIHEGITAAGYRGSVYSFSYSFPPEPQSYILSLNKEGPINMTREALINEVHHFKK